ncbi:hypothetical protein ACFQ1S_26310, partial [Kibdelosporangium lantanae]
VGATHGHIPSYVHGARLAWMLRQARTDILSSELADHLDAARDLTIIYGYAFNRAVANSRTPGAYNAVVFNHALVRDIAFVLDIILVHHPNYDPMVVLDIADSADTLTTAVDDLVDADLTTVDLDGVSLEGVRWSDRTRWPAGWEPRIRRVSVEISPGLYEIGPQGRWAEAFMVRTS